MSSQEDGVYSQSPSVSQWNISSPFTMSNPNSTSSSSHSQPLSPKSKCMSTMLGNSAGERSRWTRELDAAAPDGPLPSTSHAGGGSDSNACAFDKPIVEAAATQGTNICRPEVDTIDGVTFVAFETEDDLNCYARTEDSKNKVQHVAGGGRRRRDSDAHKAAMMAKRNSANKSSILHVSSTAGFDAVPPPPPLYKRPEIQSASSTTTTASLSTKSSAFHSDLLDNYLSKTKEDMRMRQGGELEHFGSPPADSPIYSAGVLKITEDKKTFGDLPLLSKMGGFATTSGVKRERQRWPDTRSDLDGIDNVVKKKSAKRKKPAVQLDSSEIVLSEHFYNRQELEAQFTRLMAFAVEELEALKKSHHTSPKMDDTYLRYYALSPIKFVAALPSPKDKPQKTSTPTKSAPVAISKSPPKSPDKTPPKSKKDSKEADLATIHSRHSKRDIRLPARFNQCGLILGSQWVIPGFEEPSSEKKGKKRLLEEQKRLLAKEKPKKAKKAIKFETFDGIETMQMFHEHTSSMKSKKSDKAKDLNTYLEKRKLVIQAATTNAATNKQMAQQFVNNRRVLTMGNDGHRKGINRPIIQMPKAKKNLMSASKGQLEVVPLTPSVQDYPDNVPTKQEKRTKLAELKELYRLLYFENKPERRYHYANQGIKPRVNKKQVVDEGIDTAQKLRKREKQLSYIQTCLAMWNKKLQQCITVLDGEVDEEKKRKVVQDVLSAYQVSFSYKVSAALDKKKDELANAVALQQLQAKTMAASAVTEAGQQANAEQRVPRVMAKRPSKAVGASASPSINLQHTAASPSPNIAVSPQTQVPDSKLPSLSMLKKSAPATAPRIINILPDPNVKGPKPAILKAVPIAPKVTGGVMTFKSLPAARNSISNGQPISVARSIIDHSKTTTTMTMGKVGNGTSNLRQIAPAEPRGTASKGTPVLRPVVTLPPNFNLASLTNNGGKVVLKFDGNAFPASNGQGNIVFRIKNNQLIPPPRSSEERKTIAEAASHPNNDVNKSDTDQD